MLKDKVKKSLKLCRDGNCDKCPYNGWIREVCRKVLMDDAIKVIEEPNQLRIDFEGGNNYGND